jgi:aminoglycoside phosphotransferase (APT) family kinase protein
MRPGEEINGAALAAYLKTNAASLQIEQFPSGHSNLTYLVKTDEREYVLRRGPLGPVPPKAHDMAREFRVLETIHPHFPEAPAVYHLCEDPAVLGAVFFLMERRQGIVLRDSIPGVVANLRRYPERISNAFIECLTRFHAIDIASTGLSSLGKPEGFLQRQVHGWADRWNRAQLDDATAMAAVIEWLAENIPPSPTPTLVHNDYKLDNVMLPHGSVDRIEAVLDWEMTTIGDPLADVGLTLCYWAWAHTVNIPGSGLLPSITAQAGWFSRDQFVHRYAQLTGRDMTHIVYYEVLGIFKLAVILQQIYFRFRQGQTADSRFADFGERVSGLINLASELVPKH